MTESLSVLKVSTVPVSDQPDSALPFASSQAAWPMAVGTGAVVFAPLWSIGWSIGALVIAAGLLAALAALPFTIAVALALGAAPGLVGFAWRPLRHQRLVMIGLWTVCMAAAATVTGGVTGPLAPWCFAPLLVGALLGAPAEGVVLAAAALAVLLLIELAGRAPAPPAGVFGIALSASALLLLGGATAAAVAILVGRARDRQAEAEADQAWLNGVVRDLPELVLALDRTGRLQAVFGPSLPGLDMDALNGGLVGAVSEADRPAVEAALAQAADHGAADAVFTPAGAPGRPVVLSVRRRGDTDLTALVRPIAEPPAADPIPAETVSETPDEVMAPAADEPRIAALGRKLKTAEMARDLALNTLAGALAARAEADAARQAAEANATAKSRFLANMSHELRTPLNAIMGFSDIMRQRMFGDLSAKYGEYAELIHESGRHLTDLINDVLDMSKIEAQRYTLDLEVLDAREPIGGALRLMRLQADDAGVILRGVLPQAPLEVEADRRALKQIVLNLVSNALKFTPAGGSITVTVQAVDGALELVIADTGVGIARQDLDRLGKPYEQAGDAQHKAQGTGLGLSLVRAFARLHGGDMTIESELGEGAAVTVRLPVLFKDEPAAAPAPPPPAPESAQEPAPGEGAPPRNANVIPLNLLR